MIFILLYAAEARPVLVEIWAVTDSLETAGTTTAGDAGTTIIWRRDGAVNDGPE